MLSSSFRDKPRVKHLLDLLFERSRQPVSIMEVCGGQTHAIAKYGLLDLIPEHIEIIHGPGCPVCVTPIEILELALELCQKPNILFCTFGDMLRVPASKFSLLEAKAMGANIKTVYSPLEAIELAIENPQLEIVFFGVGFETTAPSVAMCLSQAKKKQLSNFSVLACHVLVPPALKYILDAKDNRVQGFLAAGHVCSVMGYQAYEDIAQDYRTPIVVTGFEPVDILLGLLECITLFEQNRYGVINAYSRCVSIQGNPLAQALLDEVFVVEDLPWRGIGVIPQSSFAIHPNYARWDAKLRYRLETNQANSQALVCISGEILTGRKKPSQCSHFAKNCTPQNPLGAPMVSTEGACSAYYQYLEH